MPHQAFSASEPSSPRPIYPPHLQPMMQETLRTLANIDFEHEMDVARLIESGMAPALKAGVMQKLVARHRERREPYVQLLASLRAKMIPSDSEAA
jgi:hypothetical protein